MATDTRLRVTKRERKLHLSYELPHRIHTSRIYPITAPNGSTVIVYGYDKGLRILWRGGRRRRAASAAAAAAQHIEQNGTKSTEVIMLDDVDNDEPAPELDRADTEFEDEEEELDPDCPYASVIQSLDLPTGDNDVLSIAIPSLPSIAGTPRLLKRNAIVVIASKDGAIRLLQIPLKPPSDEHKEDAVKDIVRSQVVLTEKAPVPAAISIKYLPVDSQPLSVQRKQEENVEGQLLVAATSRTLSIWSVSITADAVVTEDKSLIRRLALQRRAVFLEFHPSSRSTQLLLADREGVVQIYDPYALRAPSRRPGSSDSTLQPSTTAADPGNWLIALYAPYRTTKQGQGAPLQARRKHILGVQWILSGKGILAILEDGQWGVWDVSISTKSEKGVESFAIDGYVDAAGSHDSTDLTTVTSKSTSKLAPMTPNTRKSKTEQLFAGTPKAPGAAPKGGISVVAAHSKSGLVDESVALWYDSEVYSITSTQNFWQRSIANSGTIGSLYAPGLSHITDIDLSNESITAISQLGTSLTSTTTGQMNIQRDLLISAENRIIVLQALRPSTPARNLFQSAERPAPRERPTALSEIDRALDDMATDNEITRRVGFAAH